MDRLGVNTDYRKLREFLCFLGFHSPYYKYGNEVFVTWEEIKQGKHASPPEHLGYHCRICDKKLAYRKYTNFSRWLGS